MESGLRVDERLMRLDAACVVYTLVHPVPDTASDDAVRTLDDVPVFLQVAYSLTHSVCIFANEVRLAVESVAVFYDIVDDGIHVRTEVGILLAMLVALIMHPCIASGKESLHLIVGGLEVLSASRLVAERPEYNARMVAVAQHHASCTVYISGLPCRIVRQRLVVVALDVGLVHAVQTVVVEHCIHLRLARIVAGAHGIDVGELHKRYVLEHCGHVDGVAEQWVDVLRIHSLEVFALAVDVDKIATLLY